jgi:hypothetical protein
MSHFAGLPAVGLFLLTPLRSIQLGFLYLQAGGRRFDPGHVHQYFHALTKEVWRLFRFRPHESSVTLAADSGRSNAVIVHVESWYGTCPAAYRPPRSLVLPYHLCAKLWP